MSLVKSAIIALKMVGAAEVEAQGRRIAGSFQQTQAAAAALPAPMATTGAATAGVATEAQKAAAAMGEVAAQTKIAAEAAPRIGAGIAGAGAQGALGLRGRQALSMGAGGLNMLAAASGGDNPLLTGAAQIGGLAATGFGFGGPLGAAIGAALGAGAVAYGAMRKTEITINNSVPLQDGDVRRALRESNEALEAALRRRLADLDEAARTREDFAHGGLS